MNIYIPLEDCGFGSQLLIIGAALKHFKNNFDNLYILDNIRYKHPLYDYSYYSILTDYIYFKNIKIITQPNSKCLDLIYNDKVSRNLIYEGKIKFKNECVFTNKYENLFYNYKIDSNIFRINITSKFIQDILYELKSNCEFNIKLCDDLYDYIGYHFRLINIASYDFKKILKPLIHMKLNNYSKKYIAIDNIEVFKNEIFKDFYIDKKSILDGGGGGNNCYEDIYNSAKTEVEMIENQKISFNTAINLSSCKEFYGTMHSNYSNILVGLLRKLR